MDQEREDYAETDPPPKWLWLYPDPATIRVVCFAILGAIAWFFFLWFTTPGR
jgi:hypothetical protein